MIKKILLLFLIAVSSSFQLSASASENTGKDLIGEIVIATVDNLRIRDTFDLNSKVIGHMNIGDTAVVSDVSELKVKIKDKEEFWYRVKNSSVEGWVFGGLINKNFQLSSDKNIVMWIDGDSWSDEEVLVHYFNRFAKKNISYKLAAGECPNIYLSPDGKYYAQDCGTDSIRSIGFFIAGTSKRIAGFRYIDDFKWKGGSRVEFDNVVFTTWEGCCYAYRKAVFDNGKVTFGKPVLDKSGCCGNVYRVDVPSLNAYDSIGSKGKVVCSFSKDDFIEVDVDKNDNGSNEWVKVYIENKCSEVISNTGYVLKRDLRKEK